MSGIGRIGVTTPQSSPANASPRPTDLPAVEPPVSSNDVQPTVIVSLTGAAIPDHQSLPEANPDAISKTLASIGGVNGFAWAYAHINWDEWEQKHGIDWVNEQKAIKLKAFGVFASYAETNMASNPAIPVSRAANPDATVGESLKTNYTVSDFSFTNNGSVYSITHGKDGLLNGTKDGHWWWATWQITTFTADQSEAAIALKAMTPHTTQTISTEQETSAIDITA